MGNSSKSPFLMGRLLEILRCCTAGNLVTAPLVDTHGLTPVALEIRARNPTGA